MESVCLMSELGLEPSKVKRPMQYAFDFSGGRRTIIEPIFDTIDFSNETIFWSDDGERSFDFKMLEKLILDYGHISPYDRIIVNGDISRIKDKDEDSSSSISWSELYFFNAGDINKIKKICPQTKIRSYSQSHSVVAVFYGGNGYSYAADIGL